MDINFITVIFWEFVCLNSFPWPCQAAYVNQVVDMLEASAQAACDLITRIIILQLMQTRLI